MINLDKYKGCYAWSDAIIKELEEKRAASQELCAALNKITKAARYADEHCELTGYIDYAMMDHNESLIAKYSGPSKAGSGE